MLKIAVISWAVVTIPPRVAMATQVAARLGPATRLIVDLDRNLAENHRRAWREVSAGEGSEWVGVMQDDVILCDDFVAKAERRALEADQRGLRAISLYNTHGAIVVEPVDARWSRALLGPPSKQMLGLDERTVIRSALPGELCVIVRRELACTYPAWTREFAAYVGLFPHAHDALLGLFLNMTIGGVDDPRRPLENHVYIATPNLVDHRLDVPSSTGLSATGGLPGRCSASFRPDAD